MRENEGTAWIKIIRIYTARRNSDRRALAAVAAILSRCELCLDRGGGIKEN